MRLLFSISELKEKKQTIDFFLALFSLSPSFFLCLSVSHSSLFPLGYWVQRPPDFEKTCILNTGHYSPKLWRQIFFLCVSKNFSSHLCQSFLKSVSLDTEVWIAGGIILFLKLFTVMKYSLLQSMPFKMNKIYSVIIPYVHITLARQNN